MKEYLVLIFLILLLSCETNSNKVEIIPDYDEIYLPPSEVDIPVEILGDESNQLKDIEEIIGNHYSPKNNAYYFFRSFLLISEEGKLEKVKYTKVKPYKEFKDSDINPNIDKLFPKLTEYLSKMEFSAGILNDKKVKSQFIWEGSFRTNIKGKAEFYLSSLDMKGLSNLSSFNSILYENEVEEMPSPIGGMKAIQEKIKYPEIAKRAGIQGRVYVKAFIDEEGNVAATEIIRGIGSGCDEAAIKAVKATKFNPGKQKGKPVKVQVSIPIMFKLN